MDINSYLRASLQRGHLEPGWAELNGYRDVFGFIFHHQIYRYVKAQYPFKVNTSQVTALQCDLIY